MDLFALTRRLVDIESTTPHEEAIGEFLFAELARRGFDARKMPVEGARNNVLATWPGHPRPEVVFSTHMDTVPPFIPSSEDDARIYGRGSCDAKGIIAAQMVAAEKLYASGVFVGLLFLVGEETNSVGALTANEHPIGARYMINGEPTDNRLALASKGSLHVVLTARGKMAHSAYPELGESAIDKLSQSLSKWLRSRSSDLAIKSSSETRSGSMRKLMTRRVLIIQKNTLYLLVLQPCFFGAWSKVMGRRSGADHSIGSGGWF